MKTLIAVALVLAFSAKAEDVGVSIKSNSVTHDMLYNRVEKCTATTLTSSQMDTLAATPVTLVAAPGASLGLEVTGVYVQTKPGSTPFEMGQGGVFIQYVSGASVATMIPNSTIEASARAAYWSLPSNVAVPQANTGIEAKASTDVSAGDGSVVFKVCYKTNSTNPDEY